MENSKIIERFERAQKYVVQQDYTYQDLKLKASDIIVIEVNGGTNVITKVDFNNEYDQIIKHTEIGFVENYIKQDIIKSSRSLTSILPQTDQITATVIFNKQVKMQGKTYKPFVKHRITYENTTNYIKLESEKNAIGYDLYELFDKKIALELTGLDPYSGYTDRDLRAIVKQMAQKLGEL